MPTPIENSSRGAAATSAAAAEMPPSVIAMLAGPGATQVRTESDGQRRSPRLPVQFRGTVVPTDGGKAELPQQVRVKDVSRHGIGLLCPRPMATGAYFLFQAPASSTPDRTLYLRFRVRRCTPAGRALHLVGAEYVQMFERAAPAARTAAPPGDEEVERIRKAILD